VSIAAVAQSGTLYLAALILVAFAGVRIWRNYRRRGQVLMGAQIAPAVDEALRRLLADEKGFVVLSVSSRPRVYLQFATEPNGGVVAEANCPADNETAQKVLTTAGLSPVESPPNYRAILARRDPGQLAGLVRNYFDALGAESLTMRTGQR
jgi:hypothetical protein